MQRSSPFIQAVPIHEQAVPRSVIFVMGGAGPVKNAKWCIFAARGFLSMLLTMCGWRKYWDGSKEAFPWSNGHIQEQGTDQVKLSCPNWHVVFLASYTGSNIKSNEYNQWISNLLHEKVILPTSWMSIFVPIFPQLALKLYFALDIMVLIDSWASSTEPKYDKKPWSKYVTIFRHDSLGIFEEG